MQVINRNILAKLQCIMFAHIIDNRILTFSKAENISIGTLAAYQVIGSLSAEQNVVTIAAIQTVIATFAP